QRPALEALRQPLEDGEIVVARAEGRALFPARFQLIGTMNLCPCGGRGDPAVECKCSAQRLSAFRDKLSRALLDRFDLVVTVPRPRAPSGFRPSTSPRRSSTGARRSSSGGERSRSRRVRGRNGAARARTAAKRALRGLPAPVRRGGVSTAARGARAPLRRSARAAA